MCIRDRSTLEQQLIKNLTDDNSASGIDGALRKVREIYRALCLSRSYSKETILEAYLNTISFTGTIQGVQTAANEYFNKDVSQLSLWECATIASITKNPTNYNPYTNPENLIHRRNFIMYNMWQQGVISEEDYRNGAAQPLVLAEEDSGKKPSTVPNINRRTPPGFTKGFCFANASLKKAINSTNSRTNSLMNTKKIPSAIPICTSPVSSLPLPLNRPEKS